MTTKRTCIHSTTPLPPSHLLAAPLVRMFKNGGFLLSFFDTCCVLFPAIGCTLYDCLKRQNLTEFLRLVNISDRAASGGNATTLFSLLNSTDSKVTVFAPTNEVLASSLQGLVPDPVLAGNIVRNHLVVGVVEDTQLGNQGKFMTVGGATLYTTTVAYYNFNPAYSQYIYPGYYNDAQMTTVRLFECSHYILIQEFYCSL